MFTESHQGTAQSGSGETGSLWATCTTGGRDDHPLFGGAAYVYNVIDVRQSYLQKLLKQALIAVGHGGAERSTFLMRKWSRFRTRRRVSWVAPRLIPKTPRRPFVEVSGRKGLGVKQMICSTR